MRTLIVKTGKCLRPDHLILSRQLFRSVCAPVTYAFALITSTVAGSEPSINSEAPILEYRELITTNSPPDHPNMPGFKIGKTLLTIQSVRSVTVSADGKTVTVVLNDNDRNNFAELTRKHQNGVLFIQVSKKPFIGGIGLFSSPTEDGVIEFGEARHSGEIAEYLRHRFWD